MSEDHEGESALAQPSQGPARVARAKAKGPPVCNRCGKHDRVEDGNAARNANLAENEAEHRPLWYCRRCIAFLAHTNGTV